MPCGARVEQLALRPGEALIQYQAHRALLWGGQRDEARAILEPDPPKLASGREQAAGRASPGLRRRWGRGPGDRVKARKRQGNVDIRPLASVDDPRRPEARLCVDPAARRGGPAADAGPVHDLSRFRRPAFPVAAGKAGRRQGQPAAAAAGAIYSVRRASPRRRGAALPDPRAAERERGGGRRSRRGSCA